MLSEVAERSRVDVLSVCPVRIIACIGKCVALRVLLPLWNSPARMTRHDECYVGHYFSAREQCQIKAIYMHSTAVIRIPGPALSISAS